MAPADLVFAVFREVDAISGYVSDPFDWSRRWSIELLVDGWLVDVAIANRFDRRIDKRQEWRESDHRGETDYGFHFDLRGLASSRWAACDVRIANTSTIIAHFANKPWLAASPQASAGAVFWQGGLCFNGWLASREATGTIVKGLIDEDLVVEAGAHEFHMIDARLGEARPGFTLRLPPRFADGCVHRLDVIDPEGEPLQGSPVSFIAFEGGIIDFLDRNTIVPGQRLLGSVCEALFPQSLPFSDYRMMPRGTPLAAAPAVGPIAVVLLGDEIDVSLASLGKSDADWIVGACPSERRDGRFNRRDLLAFLDDEAGTCAFVLFALAGTVFEDDAISIIAAAVAARRDSDLLYCDVFAASGDHLPVPIAFPAFDYERFLEQGYGAWCFAIDRNLARRAVVAGIDNLIGLFLTGMQWDDAGSLASPPTHIPRFLATLPSIDTGSASKILKEEVEAHLRGRGLHARTQIEDSLVFPRIHLRRMITAETVSVIVPVRDDAETVRSCVDRLRSMRTRHRLPILLVDMASSDPAFLRYIETRSTGAFNRIRLDPHAGTAAALNLGATQVQTRHLLFLDPTVVLEDAEVVDELMARCADPSVALAGATLTWPNGTVREAGLVLDFACGAVASGKGHSALDLGYGEMMGITHETAAVSARCMMVLSERHAAVGGFDEAAFPFEYLAVDYCLRMREQGYRSVVSQLARVGLPWFDEIRDLLTRPGSRGDGIRRELLRLRDRWGSTLRDDPFYNPQLALGVDSHTALAWPRRGDDRLVRSSVIRRDDRRQVLKKASLATPRQEGHL